MRKVPTLRRHKPTSQAVVTLSGHDCYLGVWPASRKTPPAQAQEKYERLVAEWLAGGRQLPTEYRPTVSRSSLPPADTRSAAADDLTVAELLVAYWDHAETYYRKPDGTPSPEIDCLRAAFRPLRKLYDDLPAAAFSPLKFKAVRESMVAAGLTRTTINRHASRIKRLFNWGVETELVPPAVAHGLVAVRGLKAGRSSAKEPRPVRPVAADIVEKTLPHLPATVAAMVQLQMLTGMRSGEVCALRPASIDRTSEIWIYRLAAHKTAHHGRTREILLGPKAQELLGPLLQTVAPEEHVFSPAGSEAHRRQLQSTARKTPRWPSHVACRNRKRATSPRRTAGNNYNPTSYARCITRACESAFPLDQHLSRGKKLRGEFLRPETSREWRDRLGPEKWHEVLKWRKAYHWHPHQLRHLKATEVRHKFGLDAAQIVLGHAHADVTQIYAQND